jgi:hypothetical protein
VPSQPQTAPCVRTADRSECYMYHRWNVCGNNAVMRYVHSVSTSQAQLRWRQGRRRHPCTGACEACTLPGFMAAAPTVQLYWKPCQCNWTQSKDERSSKRPRRRQLSTSAPPVPQPGIVYRWPMRCRLVWGMLSCVRFCCGRLNERCVASKGRSCMSRAQKRQFYKPGGAASAIRGVTVWVDCDYLHGTSGCRSRLG